MAIRLVVDLEGATRFRRRIDQLMRETGPGAGRLQLMTRLGLTVLRWVDQNFASGGGKVGGWRPLRPLTIFGRRKGSAVPLSNTGLLKGSFTYAATEDEVAVGTANRVAAWHQFGTAPYIIRPRFKKALAFPAPPGTSVPSRSSRTGGPSPSASAHRRLQPSDTDANLSTKPRRASTDQPAQASRPASPFRGTAKLRRG